MDRARVFVSSTCFDLHQVRRDLEQFIGDLGYVPVLSDSPNVSIPPGLDTVESCKWLVANSDIFVLLIGGRYGSTDTETGKSITNIEYDTAYDLRIPIYTFVDSDVWGQRDSYSRLSKMVDQGTLPAEKLGEALGNRIEDPRVFRFLSSVATAGRDEWIYEFKSAQDIIGVLQKNWSHLFRKLLFESRGQTPRLEGGVAPALHMAWADEAEGVCVLHVPPVPSRASLSEALGQLRPSERAVLELFERPKNVVDLLVASDVDLGFPGNRKKGASKAVEKTIEFIRSIDVWKERISEEYDIYRYCHQFNKRSLRPALSLVSNGGQPAEGVIAYVEAVEGMEWVKLDDRSVERVALPAKVPSEVAMVIICVEKNVAKELGKINIGNLIPRIDLGDLGIDLGDLGSILPRPRPIVGGIGVSSMVPIVRDSVENGMLRIDLREPLKHGFYQDVWCRDSVLWIKANPGTSMVLPYLFHADNLPKPSCGKLRVDVIETATKRDDG